MSSRTVAEIVETNSEKQQLKNRNKAKREQEQESKKKKKKVGVAAGHTAARRSMRISSPAPRIRAARRAKVRRSFTQVLGSVTSMFATKDDKAEDLEGIVAKRGGMTIEQEQVLKRDATKTQWSILKSRSRLAAKQEQVSSYEEGFELIKQKTGISDVDEIVKRFTEREAENLSKLGCAEKSANLLKQIHFWVF